tara:strand:+ start:1542 stop:2393 length:852 start_codon:yes stop_codon:yes gene_type:complete
MNLIIKKDNQTFGPHTTEEISEFIKNGDLVLSDLASPEGEENWEPLETLLSDSETEKEDPSFYDQFEDDDVDYDKLKEWEDVFVDEDNDTNEDEFSAQTNESVPENNPSAVSTPPPLIVPESASDQVESFTTPPPLVNPSPISVPPPESSFPATNEQVTENIESIPSSLPPPPSEPPPQKESTAKEKKVSKESSGRREPRDRISNSRKIKGLNSKQTVIVVKGEGIISKIYSTSLVFIILMVVVSLVALAGLIFAPDRVVPILTNIGVPSELIETIVPPGTGK